MNKFFNNKRNKYLTMVLIVIIIFSIFSYFFFIRKTNNFLYENNVVVGVMPGTDIDSLKAELQKQTDNSAIAFSINSNPEFKTSSINLLFENPEGNNKDLSIEILDNKTGDIIYKSKGIKEGTYLEFININKKYEPGVHNATVYITAYELETHEIIGQAAADLKIFSLNT